MDSRYKYKVIIKGDSKNFEKDEDFKLISNFLTQINWIDDVPTYYLEIHQDPTFNLINNQFSFDLNRGMNGKYKVPYDSYLTNSQIRSLYYWEYEKEKIHSLLINDRHDDMWESCLSKDLFLITTDLLEYLSKNNLMEFHNETILELQKLKGMSKFSMKFEYEILFFDPDC